MLRNCIINKSGFSLIEMMIVVSIIGFMASIALPEFEEYRKKSRRAESYINIDAIQKAHAINRAENGYFQPNARYRPANGAIQPNQKSQIYYYAPFMNSSTSFARNYMSSLADVIPPGTYSYYDYVTHGGNFFDDGNIGGSFGFTTIGGETTFWQNNAGSASKSLNYFIDDSNQCSIPADFAETGLNVGGEGYSIVLAATRTDTNSCELIAQSQITSEGAYLRTPFITAKVEPVNIKKD